MSRKPDVNYAAQNGPRGSSEISIILDIFLVIFHVFFSNFVHESGDG